MTLEAVRRLTVPAPPFTLANTSVVVVGASSGMGWATARLAYELGARVLMVSRNGEKLRRGARAIADGEPRLRTVTADLTTEAARTRIVEHAGDVDHLVVTAADLAYMPFVDFTGEAAMRMVLSKVVGPFFLAQRVAPKMKREGSMTFVSGIAADRPIHGGTMTATVNGAVNAMVRALAVELAPTRVNAVSPGWVDTPIWKNVMSEERKAEAFRAMEAKIPARRVGRPEDVAQAIVAAMTNGFISGSVIYVDGGQRLV